MIQEEAGQRILTNTWVILGRSSKQSWQTHLDSMPHEPSLPWGEY